MAPIIFFERFDEHGNSTSREGRTLWYVSRIGYESQTGVAEVEVREGSHPGERPVLYVGPEGFQAYQCEQAVQDGVEAECGLAGAGRVFPADGWGVVDYRTTGFPTPDTTDLLVHENGWVTALTCDGATLFSSESDALKLGPMHSTPIQDEIFFVWDRAYARD